MYKDVVPFLHFVSAADDAATYPTDKLLSISTSSNGQCELTFVGSTNDGSAVSVDVVTLTITADTEDAVHQAICEAMVEKRNIVSVLPICNGVTGTFLHSDILSCTITRDA